MKQLLLLLLLSAPALSQTGMFYQFPVPLPGATFRVCPVGTQNPCPSPQPIFSDSALTQAIGQPAQTGPTGQFGFYVAGGQYTMQIGQPYNFVYIVNLGGGSGGVAGSNTQVQFNDNGQAGGNTGFTFNKTTGNVVVQGPGATDYNITLAGQLSSSLQPITVHSSNAVGLDMYSHSSVLGNKAPFISFSRSRGTQGSPSPVTFTAFEADLLGGMNFTGYDGTGYFVGPSIFVFNDETWTATNHGASIHIYGTGVGSVSQQEIAQFGGIGPNLEANTDVIFFRNLKFLGGLNSDPMIKAIAGSSPIIAIRKADDSGPASLQVGSLAVAGGSTAGTVGLTQGTAPSTTAGTVQIVAPGSVTAYNMLLPGAASTGFLSCSASGATDTCSFAASAVSNYYTNTTGTGIGPTVFTPAAANTLDILDSTVTTGSTKVFLGYDGGGSFTAGHISPVRTNLSIVSGSTTAGTQQTDDAISFFNAAGTYRGGIITNASGNNFAIGAPAGVNLALLAAGGAAALVTGGGVYANQASQGLGSTLTSTATISTSGQPVKADTSNANQVVVTTTTDTGAGIVIGVCSNNPTAGNSCFMATTGVMSMTLGTGTCAIGNWVQVDTTTNGRVLCSAVFNAGKVIGVAMAAQAAVGSNLNVMVGLK